MKRVVITGIGIVSSIGTDADSVTQSLRDAKSGIVGALITQNWASARR